MCSLCGVLGGEEPWTTGSGRITSDAIPTRRAERLARVRMANLILSTRGLRVDDWQGSAFVVANATGKQEIVPDLAAIWRVAAEILGRPLDPLDPELIARLTDKVR